MTNRLFVYIFKVSNYKPYRCRRKSDKVFGHEQGPSFVSIESCWKNRFAEERIWKKKVKTSLWKVSSFPGESYRIEIANLFSSNLKNTSKPNWVKSL